MAKYKVVRAKINISVENTTDCKNLKEFNDMYERAKEVAHMVNIEENKNRSGAVHGVYTHIVLHNKEIISESAYQHDCIELIHRLREIDSDYARKINEAFSRGETGSEQADMRKFVGKQECYYLETEA